MILRSSHIICMGRESSPDISGQQSLLCQKAVQNLDSDLAVIHFQHVLPH